MKKLYATSMSALLFASLLSVAVGATTVRAQEKGIDAVRNDVAGDAKFAPTMAELAITSHGSRMNGFIYLAAGAGSHPLVILLHGFPGNERNLDVAQAARRAGYDVLYFDYRGSWGSGGTFSFVNSRDDVAAALSWARNPANVAKYHIDPKRIALVGHSMGGWMAYEAAALDPDVACVAGLAAWNLAEGGRIVRKDPAARKSTIDYFNDVTRPGAPLHSTGPALLNEILNNIEAYDYLRLAPLLRNRSMLLIGATRDSPDEDPTMNAKMEKALKAAGASHVQTVTYDDDHPFSAHRIGLSELIVQWLNGDCAAVSRSRR